MPLYTKDELAERYDDYQEGWISGASNITLLDLIGTSSPKHQAFFERGYEDGREAFNAAMNETWEYIKITHKTVKE